MAKGKAVPVQNRPLYSRISFLQQAATYLTQASGAAEDASSRRQGMSCTEKAARRLVTDLRGVSLKARIRLSPAVKQTLCKYCDALLVEGETCTTVVENKSKGGWKPWADMLVRKCHACGRVKRHPLNSARQKRKSFRPVVTEADNLVTERENLATVGDTITAPSEASPCVSVQSETMT